MKKADELIQRFLDTIGQSDGAVYVKLFQTWRNVAGERIADHARPVDVKGSQLVVETDHPGWSQMVIMKRTRILTQLNKRLPELKLTGIAVHLSSAKAKDKDSSEYNRPEGPAEEPPPRKPSADDKQALEQIEDAELRQMLERLRGEL